MRQTQRELHGFSIRLKKARENMNYTQAELSKKSKVALRTIERLEIIPKSTQSVSPLALNVLYLAQALDVTPEYLLLGDDNMDIYMNDLEKELKNLTKEDIYYYHKQKLSPKVLAHLKLTDEFVDQICNYWTEHTLKCNRPYVQDTIIRYCHNRKKNIP